MEPYYILYLNRYDMQSLGVSDMKLALQDVEAVFSLRENGDVLAPFKVVMGWGDPSMQERINGMPGYLGGKYDIAGIKWIGSNPKNVLNGIPRASALTILNDPVTKLPVAILDGTEISAMRTGASSGVAVKYLSKPDSRTITVFGAGVQGRTQLEAAVCANPNLTKAYIYDPFHERSVNFAHEMSEKLNIDVEPVTDPKPHCLKSDVVITATVATEPVIGADWISPGTLYINMGTIECTDETVLKADKRVVDNWEDVKHRLASTIAIMASKGIITDDDIYANLGEIVVGKKPGRENESEIIYYNSVGMGLQDIAIACRVYREAVARNAGTKLLYW